MAEFIQTYKKIFTYIELVAYFLALSSFFFPFKHISPIVEKSNGKRNSILDLYNKEQASTEIEKYNLETGNLLFIQYWFGVFVLGLTILSAVVVVFNSFIKKWLEGYKNKISNGNIVDLVVEIIPLAFTAISLALTFFSIGNGALTEVAKVYNAQIYMSFGYYLLLISLILAIAVRIVYMILAKDDIILSDKPKYVEQIDEDEV